MKTRRLDYSQGSIQSQEARLKDNEVGLDRTVYANISSLTDNKSIVTPDDDDTPYHRWLLAMNEYQDTGIITPELQRLDEYLGELGVTEDYQYNDDTYNIEAWIAPIQQEPTRNVVYGTETNKQNVIFSDGTII